MCWRKLVLNVLNNTGRRASHFKLHSFFMGSFEALKGDLLCKNHFYKAFEHSFMAAVCENNQPINVKNPPTHFFFIKPINHEQSLQTSGFRICLCSHHRGEKVPPMCDALCPISITQPWVRSCGLPLLELYTMSVPKSYYKCCVLGCTNEHRSLHNLPSSEPRTLWLNFIFEGNILEKICNVP